MKSPITFHELCCHRNCMKWWQLFSVAQILGQTLGQSLTPKLAPNVCEWLKQQNSWRAHSPSAFLRYAHEGQMDQDDLPWSIGDAKSFSYCQESSLLLFYRIWYALFPHFPRVFIIYILFFIYWIDNLPLAKGHWTTRNYVWISRRGTSWDVDIWAFGSFPFEVNECLCGCGYMWKYLCGRWA